MIMLSSASNKAISAKAPSLYLKEVMKAAGDQLEKWLLSNLICREAFEAALRDDYDSFLTLRASAIHSAILEMTDWV